MWPLPRVKINNKPTRMAPINIAIPPPFQTPIQRFHTKRHLPIQQSNRTGQLPTTLHANHIFDQTGNKLNIDKLITMPTTKDIWINGLNNELGRLSNGYRPNNVKGTNMLRFIYRNTIPPNRKITYSNFVCNFQPLKKEKFRVRMTVDGAKLDYPHDTASPTAALINTKLIINSTISDHKIYGSRFCSIDIKDFFLQTTMDTPEYIRIHKRYFSEYFIREYNLNNLINKDNYIYCEITKGMYDLKQAAILAYKQLVGRLKAQGYHPIPTSNGL